MAGLYKMAEKKRRSRRDYLNDFRPNVAGEYVYTGTLYTLCATEDEKKSLRRRLAAQAAGIVLAVVLAGSVNSAGMTDCAYVLLPYAGEAIAAFVTVWSLVRLLGGGDPLRAYIYEGAVKKLPDRAMILAVLTGVSAGGLLLYLILHGFGGKTVGTLICLATKAAQLLLAREVRRTLSKAAWVPQDKRAE